MQTNAVVSAGLAALLWLAPAALAAKGDYRQVVDGVAVYLGVVPAELVRGHPPEHPEGEMHGGVPAGLAAAITLAGAGLRVVVHEAQREVGYRFQGDLQGLENWTTECDVLDELRETGLTAVFAQRACHEGTAFDAWGQAYPVRSRAPLFYMVERGPGPGSLDTDLCEQARARRGGALRQPA